VKGRPKWQRRQQRRGWLIDARRCWCGWYLDTAGRHDPRFVGHAPTCPVGRFAWITTPEQVSDMRRVLITWAAEMERVSADPQWLLEAPWDWRQALDVWQAGVTNRAIERGWERP
jgi:hypothetical protein